MITDTEKNENWGRVTFQFRNEVREKYKSYRGYTGKKVLEGLFGKENVKTEKEDMEKEATVQPKYQKGEKIVYKWNVYTILAVTKSLHGDYYEYSIDTGDDHLCVITEKDMQPYIENPPFHVGQKVRIKPADQVPNWLRHDSGRIVEVAAWFPDEYRYSIKFGEEYHNISPECIEAYYPFVVGDIVTIKGKSNKPCTVVKINCDGTYTLNTWIGKVFEGNMLEYYIQEGDMVVNKEGKVLEVLAKVNLNGISICFCYLPESSVNLLHSIEEEENLMLYEPNNFKFKAGDIVLYKGKEKRVAYGYQNKNGEIIYKIELMNGQSPLWVREETLQHIEYDTKSTESKGEQPNKIPNIQEIMDETLILGQMKCPKCGRIRPTIPTPCVCERNEEVRNQTVVCQKQQENEDNKFNLAEYLGICNEGHKFYSSVYGEIEFDGFTHNKYTNQYGILMKYRVPDEEEDNVDRILPCVLTNDGRLKKYGKCIVWPSEAMYEKYPADPEIAWQEWYDEYTSDIIRPNDGETYYYITTKGAVAEATMKSNDKAHYDRWKFGNMFSSQEDCEYAITKAKGLLQAIHAQFIKKKTNGSEYQ